MTDAPAQVRQPRPTQLQPSRHGLERRPADQQQAAAIAGATTKARSLTTSRVCRLASLRPSHKPMAVSARTAAANAPLGMASRRRGEAMPLTSASAWSGCTISYQNDQTGLGGLRQTEG